MKILYLLQEIPYPLTNGVRVKAFNIISYMSRSHECHIITFSDDDTDSRMKAFRREVPGVKFLGHFHKCSGLNLHLGRLIQFVRGQPVFLARWNRKPFARMVQKAVETTCYDVVHLDSIGMAPCINLLNSIPTVISTTDAVSLAYRCSAEASNSLISKAYRLFVANRTACLERRLLPLFSKVHVVSKRQREYLSTRVPGAEIVYIEHVVPNEVLQYEKGSSLLDGKKRIIFTGSLTSESIACGLLAFLYSVFPFIQQKCPDMELTILGGKAPAKILNRIRGIRGVKILGWVEDYLAELMKAQVVIFPDLIGTGVKTRVLYALALGKAVVATSVALEGIETCDGVHCYEREVNNEFAKAVISLLNTPSLRKGMSQRAKRLINKKLQYGSYWFEMD